MAGAVGLVHVAVVGAGLMGPQIAVDYALGGHHVFLCGRDALTARERVEKALAAVAALGVAGADSVKEAGARLRVGTQLPEDDLDLVVEAVSERLDVKAALLWEVAARHPQAVLASNTSSLSISALGRACEAETRLLGTHYWNPAYLMPLVELVPGEATDPVLVDRVESILRALGKRPVRVADVPGFAWNRLQFALLREALWIVENGVATQEDVDEIVRSGLARRWRLTGPFETAALGGVATFRRIAENLMPALSVAEDAEGLREVAPTDTELEQIRNRRDAGLAQQLLFDRTQE
jgi:3-hydroxybutyryl-CoA dehydrogenase